MNYEYLCVFARDIIISRDKMTNIDFKEKAKSLIDSLKSISVKKRKTFAPLQ